MIGLIQRVSSASVSVAGEVIGDINAGLLLLLCAQPADTPAIADKLLTKLLAYRVFGDDVGKMNLSLTDTQGGLLIVSQFTLAAETQKGTRPGFSKAAPPELARHLYDYFCAQAAQLHSGKVATGRFGADMQVALVNDGPVTFWLELN